MLVGDGETLNPRARFAAGDRAQYVAKRGRLRRTVRADELPAEEAVEAVEDEPALPA